MPTVLVINCGSATVKWRLYDAAGPHAIAPLGLGLVERIAQPGGPAGHGAAVDAVVASLQAPPDLVGHRVVHGGERFRAPAVLDDAVIAALDEVSRLAPLHNPPALAAIRACRSALGPGVPQVAVFDTAFHSTLPPYAAAYAIPTELATRHGIRRYGFHGLAHSSMVQRYAELSHMPLDHVTAVTLQLGNGCSVTAVRNGASVDTSMGFTPLEGLVMGTRSGDIDAGAVAHLAAAEGVEGAEVVRWLNERSGLLGLSGVAADLRDVLAAAAQGNAVAGLAIDVFCYRALKYVGAYLTVLGGPAPLLFGGGIGEHSALVRQRICDGLAWLGIELDPARNAAHAGAEGRISSDRSSAPVYVLPVDEEAVIAQQVLQTVALTGPFG
ncbi:MAG: acetate/propionate family kinase [Chloroflexota bacterium]